MPIGRNLTADEITGVTPHLIYFYLVIRLVFLATAIYYLSRLQGFSPLDPQVREKEIWTTIFIALGISFAIAAQFLYLKAYRQIESSKLFLTKTGTRQEKMHLVDAHHTYYNLGQVLSCVVSLFALLSVQMLLNKEMLIFLGGLSLIQGIFFLRPKIDLYPWLFKEKIPE